MEQEEKGLGFDVKIKVPEKLKVIQLAQQCGISAWDEGDHVVLSGIDEVEIGRFLRQYNIMSDAQVAVLFGGRLAGHKSLEDGEKADYPYDKDSEMGGVATPYRNRREESIAKTEGRLGRVVESDSRSRQTEQPYLEALHREKVGRTRLDKYAGKKAMEDEEYPEGEEQDQTPYDEGQPVEPDEEKAMEGEDYSGEGPEEGMESGMYGEHDMEGGMGEEGPTEKLGAQVLRELHQEAMSFLEKYDPIVELVEHEGINKRLLQKLQACVSEMEEIEAEFEKHYPDYDQLHDKDMEAEGFDPDHEEMGASGESLPEPSPDEVVEGMSQGAGTSQNDEPEPEPLDEKQRGQKSLEDGEKAYPQTLGRGTPEYKGEEKRRADRNARKEQEAYDGGVERKPRGSKPGDTRLDKYVEADKKKKGLEMFIEHAEKTLGEVHEFLGKLGSAKALDQDLRAESFHYSKTLNMIQNRVDKVFGETMAGKKGSLLPAPSGDALEGEDKEADVNKPTGPSTYKPGQEPMQQFGKDGNSPNMKGGVLDGSNAFADPLASKDTDSHINQPTSPNSHVKPGKDKEHMAFGKDGEWPHKGQKGSLLPKPSGNAGEGEPEEVNVNKPSSNPQAKPGEDSEHQWFGKPGEWPSHKKNFEETANFLMSVYRTKDFGEGLRSQARSYQKGFECFNTQTSAVGVTKPSSNSQVKPGQDTDHMAWGHPADWPHKSLDSLLDNRDKKLAEINDFLNKLTNGIKKV